MLLEGMVILTGSIAYMVLSNSKDKTPSNTKETPEHPDKHVTDTYEYFYNLTLDEQRRYFSDNLDLLYYKHDKSVGFTQSVYFNAKHAAEIARRTGKCFNNKNKVY